MTALAACLSWSGDLPARAAVDRMLRAQAMFGPDASAAEGSGEIAMGRNLLRMLPEDVFDRQPLPFAGGRYWLAADLRLDNRAELQDRLGLPGHAARLMADVALLASAFERWGIAATLPRLVGVFAIAIWDQQERELILARDISSHRPLHYSRQPGFVAVATMPKGLFALDQVSRALNETRLAEYAALLPERGPVTLFKEVSRVPPGHLLRLSRERTETVQWCDLSQVPLQRFASFEEAVEALDEVLQTAVGAHLRSIGGVGSHLSAGIDSGIVSAIAARQLAEKGKGLHAFTAAPRDPDCLPRSIRGVADEAPEARRIAALFANVEHRVIHGDADSMAEANARFVAATDMPALNPTNSAWLDALQRQARAEGVTTLLDATNGNMTFSADLTLISAEMRAQLSPLAFALRLARLARCGDISPRRAVVQALDAVLPNRVFAALHAWLSRAPAPVAGVPFLRDEVVATHDLAARTRRRFLVSATSREAAGNIRLFLAQQWDAGIARKAFQGLNRIDERDVCADLRLTRFCLSIPAEMFTRGCNRALGRALYRRHLPEACLAGVKRGWQDADASRLFLADAERIAEEIARATRASAVFREVDARAFLAAQENALHPGLDLESFARGHRRQVRYSRLFGISQFLNHMEGRNS